MRDPAHEPDEINTLAAEIGDPGVPRCYRRYARFWLEDEYKAAAVLDRTKPKTWTERSSAPSDIVFNDAPDPDEMPADIPRDGWTTNDLETEDTASTPDDEPPSPTLDLGEDEDLDDVYRGPPTKGMQIHSDYTWYGLLQYFRRRFAWVEKTRWFIDDERSLRAALMAAFKEEALADRFDAFIVSFDIQLPNWKRSEIAKASRNAIKAFMHAHGCKDANEAIVQMLTKNVRAARSRPGGLLDTWIRHPLQTKDQPNKRIRMLTDRWTNPPDGGRSSYEDDHIARLLSLAGLKATDQFFLQVRYRIRMLARSVKGSNRRERVWHVHNPYNPINVQRTLTMFRCYYNYCQAGEDGKTPAMRLGLADGPVDLAKIIGHRWT